MERKTFKFAVKSVDEEEGILEGYGSTFNDIPDAYGDVIDSGAFTKTLKENSDNIVSLFNHSIMEPIGKPEAIEDSKGLQTKIKLVKGVQRADETLLLAKAGVIKKFSIGFDTIKSELVKGIRHLKEIKLYDISPVIFAANPSAEITAVKSELDNILKTGRVLSPENREKVEVALKAFQALLEPTEDEEPSLDTLPSKELKEAAEMAALVGKINAEIGGFDYEAASARIEEFIKNMEVN